MNFTDYQFEAGRTDNADLDYRTHKAVLLLGICGEAGELADVVKKQWGHGHEAPPMDELIDELGDLLWYITRFASIHGIDLEDIASQNIQKLKARYPDGFSEERSRNRSP